MVVALLPKMTTRRCEQTMSGDDIDLPRESEEEIPDGDAKRSLMKIAEDILRVQKQVADIESNLSLKKAELRHLEQVEMPAAMMEVNGSPNDFRFQNGLRVRLTDDVYGSIPKEEPERQQALDYLVEMGGADLYKTTLSIPFQRRQHNSALALAEELREKGYEVTEHTGVHPSSLGAWAREKIAANEPVDWLRLGLQRMSKAKLSLPKGETSVKF